MRKKKSQYVQSSWYAYVVSLSLVVNLSRVSYMPGPYICIINVSKLVSAFGRYVCLELSVILAWPAVIDAFMFLSYFILFFGGRGGSKKSIFWLKVSVKMEVRVSGPTGVCGESGSSHISNVPQMWTVPLRNCSSPMAKGICTIITSLSPRTSKGWNGKPGPPQGSGPRLSSS